MPRPNRYHPYTRDSQRPSSRYSPASAALKPPRRMPTISEEKTGLPTPYHYIKPDFIRGVTLEGSPLVAKSIIRSADGVYHVQLQVAPFPSEQARYLACNNPYASPAISPLLPPHLSPSPSSLGFKPQDMQRKNSAAFSSQSGSSVSSVSGESTLTTDDDTDATREVDDFETQRWRMMMEQQRYMDIMVASQNQMHMTQ